MIGRLFQVLLIGTRVRGGISDSFLSGGHGYCIRNWFNIKWLSGDILDQEFTIDVVTWFMDEMPIKAVGYGGSARRLTGDIFDFFSVDYTYNNNKKMLHTARQIDGCDGNVSGHLLGTKGTAATIMERLNFWTGRKFNGNMIMRKLCK